MLLTKQFPAKLTEILTLSEPTCLSLCDFAVGFNLAEILPTIDSLLTSPSLVDAGVAQDAQFKFLVSAGFEQLERVHS